MTDELNTPSPSHEHCFHRDDPLMGFFGGNLFDVCCHCGTVRALPRKKPEDIPEGHGPYSIHSKGDTLAPVVSSDTPRHPGNPDISAPPRDIQPSEPWPR